jgi:hypothetical protein
MKTTRKAWLALLLSTLACATNHAATFTVTNTLSVGAGSLNAAIALANATPELDVIAFNIPGAGVQTIAPDTALPIITAPVIIDGYTQPGATPNTLTNGENAVLRIELSGAQSGGSFNGLVFREGGVNSTVRGLVINRFASSDAIQFNYDQANPASNVVEGCFIGTDATGMVGLPNFTGVRTFRAIGNRIGGTTPAARNLISKNNNGILLVVGSSSNSIQGNFIGIDATGTNALANGTAIDVQSGANNCIIGGDSVAARNIIAGGGSGFGINCVSSAGHIIQGNFIGTDVTGTKALSFSTPVFLSCSSSRIGGFTSIPGTPPGNLIAGGLFVNLTLSPVVNDPVPSGNMIQGNLIGTDVTGTLDLGSAGDGISLTTANNNIIGGATTGAGNVISGNNGRGIVIDAGNFNLIQGNRIGTDITGANPLGNGGNGIEVRDHDNTIRGNMVAFNGADGINVDGARSTNTFISANSIFGNGTTVQHLGIDLGGNGVTPNDAGDTDNGANHLQNFPVLTNVIVSLAGVTVQGVLDSAPNTILTVEFFANDICETSISCQGHTFIGSTNLTTGATGTNFFSVTMPTTVSCRFRASATATDPDGNTSEFSACRESTGMDTDGDGACDVEEVLAGTDPSNAESVFRITAITLEGNDARITWQAGGGRTNILQTITSLAANSCSNDFTDLPPEIVLPGEGDVVTNRLHVGGATNRARYYRVRLLR